MRAAIYARISKDREGAGVKVATQEQDCRDLAAQLGATVTAVHADNDISAYSGKPRPGYKALLDDISGGRVDIVLVWHTDRLHRSPRELEDYITVCEPERVRTHSVRSGQLDLSTPTGQLVARNLGAAARYEVDHAIERMRRSKQRVAESGEWKGGRRPFGFEADGVTVREDEAALVRSAADSILAGASVASVARDWNAAGSTTTTGKHWGPSAPRRVLLRPRNAGLMEHRGEIIGKAAWPEIVPEETWRAVVRLLEDPQRRTNPGSSLGKWLGSGLFRCGVCGDTVRATMSDGRRAYRCRSTSHLVRNLADVDGYVEAVMVERLRRADLSGLLARLERAPDVQPLEARAVALRERLDQLAELFTEGAIDAQQLASGSRRLQAELEDVRSTISSSLADTSVAGVVDAADPGQAWLDADLSRRRAVLSLLATVTLGRSGLGRPGGWRAGDSYFRPDTVSVDWALAR